MPLRTRVKRFLYRARYDYLTLNNIVIAIAFGIAASWAWGSVSVMQRNFTLQRNLEQKQRQLTLAQLQVDTERYQQAYYKSTEYQELAAREHLGLAAPGEKKLILPANSDAAKAYGKSASQSAQSQSASTPAPSTWQQWWNFLSGANVRQLHP